MTAALAEIAAPLSAIDRAAVEQACRRIADSGRIGLYGCGREGLMMRGLAMRLHHCGLDAHYVGEMTMPALRAGDLFFASSGPGRLSTVQALLQTARAAGAGTMVVTAVPESPDASLAEFVLHLPAQTMASDRAAGASTVLPMGSIFEGAMFVLFEIMVARIAGLRGADAVSMRARHTNME